ncbi:beta-ketoacyl-[acyl-carrier-protein] synthase family protein, partial [Leisingera sp. ANG-M1]|uniref:beta-ketoacyl-[acyl-carrier-protein] synthase family protein n=1 Tax=Leisingera sp. ANG-M1 TaxID=1577895 RepID=UPI00068C076F
MTERVVVTGIGLLSAIGNDYHSFAKNVLAGTNGIAQVSAFDPEPLAARLGGEVDIDLSEHFPEAQLRRMDRCSMLAVVAARQSMAMAGLDASHYDKTRVGVFLGTTLGGMIGATAYYEAFARKKEQRLSYLQDYPLYSAGARVIEDFGFSGPNLAFSTACSSGNVALGHGADYIRHGRCDMVLAGGVDTMAKITLAGFNALKNVSPEAIRPFDRNRTGVVLSEAAAILVLESETRARARGATILAEIAGYGMSTDAYHMTAPDATGRGPALAVSRALAQAGLTPADIDHVNAHGTATKHNDEIEARVIRKVFGTLADGIPVTSTKSQHGHALGAAGAVEAAAAIAAIQESRVPPTLNHEETDPKCNVDVVAGAPRDHRVNAVLSNNFGFGGNNCTVIFTHT